MTYEEGFQAGKLFAELEQTDRIAELEKLVHQRFDDGKRLGVLETEDRFRTTPQIKELSDEEILNLADDLLLDCNNDIRLLEFARAILKKASER